MIKKKNIFSIWSKSLRTIARRINSKQRNSGGKRNALNLTGERNAETGDMKLKRRVILAAIFMFFFASAALVYFRQYEAKNNPSFPKNEIVERYREELPDLKKKAKSNKAADIKNYAVAQYVTGDIDGSEESYKKLIREGGDSAIVHNNLGNVLRDKKNFEEAAREYKTAIEKDKALLSAYYNLGSVYQYSLGRTNEAVEVYKSGIENNPNVADLHIFLGQAYEQMSDIESAKRAYETALRIKTDHAAGKAGLERLNRAS